LGPGTSAPSVLIRRRRSEDRFVIVVGTLLSILFVGVSNPHPVLALFSEVSARAGVILPPVEAFVEAIPFRDALTPFVVDDDDAPIPSLRNPDPPDPGGPTIPKLAAKAAAVARASCADVLRCRTMKRLVLDLG
jgi:hypothetical protein